MRLSPDISTRMELWKSNGIKRLQEMLAKMGLPLAQCQQQYAFMKAGMKARLKEMVQEHAEVCSQNLYLKHLFVVPILVDLRHRSY